MTFYIDSSGSLYTGTAMQVNYVQLFQATSSHSFERHFWG